MDVTEASRIGPIAVISMHADPLAPLGAGQNGGMNLAIRRLVEALGRRGVTCDVFTRRADAEVPHQEMLGELSRVIRLPVGPAQVLPPAETVDWAPAMLAAIIEHSRLQRREYALIHAHHWVAGLVAEPLRDSWQVPWAHSFHTLARVKHTAGLHAEPGRDQMEARWVAGADRLIAISRSEARELQEYYGADPDRTCVVQLGADQETSTANNPEELRARLGLSGHRVILYAGRLEPLKGAETLLDAIACLVAGPGYDDVVALIVGDDAQDGERDRLEQIAVSRGINGRVRFVGSVAHDDLGDYYSVADVCVVPSRAESFGLVALEAQAAGTAVIAANVGGLREIVEDGVSGILVEPGDVTGFCHRIAEVLGDPALSVRMGEAGRRRAGAYTWDRAAARLEAIYALMRSSNPTAPCADSGVLG